MKDFFRKSFNFWITSRIIIIILIFISAFGVFSVGRLRSHELAINLLVLVLAIILSIITIQDFTTKTSSKWLKIISGTLLITFGIALIIVLLNVKNGGGNDFYLLGFPMGIWIVLIGVFEVLRLKKP